MSVLIKGMQMPKSCFDCPCLDKQNGICQANADKEYVYSNKPSWCPLIELPPHGRLIDADAMIVSVKRQTDVLRIVGGNLAATGEILERGILQEIKNAPTIIESEDEDG